LTAVGKATSVNKDFSEDKSLMDNIKDALRTVKRAIDLGTGAINDVTRMMADVKNTIRDIVKIMDACTTCMNAAQNFVDGVTDFIQLPYAFLDAANRQLEAAIGVVSAGITLGETIDGYKADKMPEFVIQKLRTLHDSLEILGTHPSKWETNAEATIRKLREQQSQLARWNLYQQSLLGLVTPPVSDVTGQTYVPARPTSYDEVNRLGTTPTEGDVTSMGGEITTGGEVLPYQSYQLVPVEDGDTLLSLAAKYMGDARLWVYIAIANGLKAPFVDRLAAVPLTNKNADEQPFGQALGVGAMIRIPTYAQSTVNFPILPVLGAHLDEPIENQFLGTDWQLEPTTPEANNSVMVYDVPIDFEKGSVDAVVVSGVENLKQSILVRLSVEQGTNLLYRKLGLRRIVGMSFPLLDLEMAKFMIAESLAADPRIANIQNVQFQQVEDRFETDLQVVVRGLSEARAVNVSV
jgi:hypothetical protein